MRSRSEQAERSQEEYRAESAFNKSSPQCQLQRNLPVMLHPRIVKQHICINAFQIGTGRAEPGGIQGRKCLQQVLPAVSVAEEPPSNASSTYSEAAYLHKCVPCRHGSKDWGTRN